MSKSDDADRNLLEFLRQHPGRSKEQIAAEINGDAKTATGRLSALKDDGRVYEDDGRYYIANG